MDSAVEQFLGNAQRLLAAAEGARDAGAECESMTVAVGQGGAIRILDGSDWPLDRVAAFHNAAMVYRVRRQKGEIVLEGRAAGHKLVLRSEDRAPGPAHRLLRPGVLGGISLDEL